MIEITVPCYVLGVDPGKSTGYALIKVVDGRIEPTGVQGVAKNESVKELEPLLRQADVVVVEDFKVRPTMARKGRFDYNDMVAPRVIGKVELLCEIHEKTMVKQQASLKPPAYGMANLKYVKGKKNQHWQDAYAHACYYAVKNLGAQPVSSKDA